MKHFLLVLSTAILARAQVDVPQAGWMLDHSGTLRAVAGVAQSFVAGDALRSGVLSAACGAAMCLAKTDSALITDSGSVIAAPAGPALIAIRKSSALLYFPQSRQFAEFKDGALNLLNWTVDGETLAFRAGSIAVRRDDGVWIVTADGSIQAALPPRTAAVLLLDGAVLYSLPHKLVLRRGDGSELSFAIEGVTSLAQMGEHYVQASSASSIFALRIDPGREQVSVLPDSGGAQ